MAFSTKVRLTIASSRWARAESLESAASLSRFDNLMDVSFDQLSLVHRPHNHSGYEEIV
jgi:hypothetical protein